MWLRTLLLALMLAAGGLAAQAEEHIKRFRSDIEIARTGVIRVTETIEIVSEGKTIKHGIYRDFPLGNVMPEGMQPVQLKVISVERDGAREDYHPGAVAGGRRIYIGKADVLLPPGEHSYRLTYTMDNRIRSAGSNDMFAWDVAGDWPYRIDAAEATVRLPEGVTMIASQQHAGTADTMGDFVEVSTDGPVTTFKATRPLEAGERLAFKFLIKAGAISRPAAKP